MYVLFIAHCNALFVQCSLRLLPMSVMLWENKSALILHFIQIVIIIACGIINIDNQLPRVFRMLSSYKAPNTFLKDLYADCRIHSKARFSICIK